MHGIRLIIICHLSCRLKRHILARLLYNILIYSTILRKASWFIERNTFSCVKIFHIIWTEIFFLNKTSLIYSSSKLQKQWFVETVWQWLHVIYYQRVVFHCVNCCLFCFLKDQTIPLQQPEPNSPTLRSNTEYWPWVLFSQNWAFW